MGTLFFITDLVIIVDFIIFKIWKFHINAMVINIMTSPAAWESLHLAKNAIMIVIAILIALFFIQYLLYQYLEKSSLVKIQSYNRTFNRKVLPLLFIMIIGEKIYFGMADVYNERAILESVKPIPLYQPLTFVRFVERHFGIKAVKKEAQGMTISKNSTVHYPLAPINISKNSPSPHIFIFMFDAARASRRKIPHHISLIFPKMLIILHIISLAEMLPVLAYFPFFMD